MGSAEVQTRFIIGEAYGSVDADGKFTQHVSDVTALFVFVRIPEVADATQVPVVKLALNTWYSPLAHPLFDHLQVREMLEAAKDSLQKRSRHLADLTEAFNRGEVSDITGIQEVIRRCEVATTHIKAVLEIHKHLNL